MVNKGSLVNDGKEIHIRIENVFSMVAQNPRYNPKMPSCLKIRKSTVDIES